MSTKSTPDANARFVQHMLARKAEHRNFDFDTYYHHIRDCTWQSSILPFSLPLARACVNYYQARFNSRPRLFQSSDAALLRNLETTIDSAMRSFSGCDQFFIRMSNRSPKDGFPLESDRLRRDFFEELTTLHGPDVGASDTDGSVERLLETVSANDIMVAYSAAQLRALRVDSGRAALCLLLSSERVFVDLNLALNCHEHPNDEWQTYLILREWDDDLCQDWEFRCFVNSGRLRAVSQYNHYCVFESLLEVVGEDDGRDLCREIEEYWKSVQDAIPMETYVMDVARLRNGRWCVVELNPFATTTGGGMFDWKVDRNVLTGTDDAADEVSFRVRKTPCEDLDLFVQAEVLPLIDATSHVSVGTAAAPWNDFELLGMQDANRDPEKSSENVWPETRRCVVS